MNFKQIPVAVRLAGTQDVDAIAPLFDAYRQFYGQVADRALAANFIRARLMNGESTVFMAITADDQTVGFCQLYPSFCSVMTQPIGVLYDLFVSPPLRKSGIGHALMQAAEQHAHKTGWARLDLTTAKTNTQAQALYESLGWVQDDVFFAYNKVIGP